MLTDNTYLCLAVLDGIFCVIFLHGRNSPQSSPTSTPKLIKSLSFEMQPDELIEKPMSPMQYARSGLGTAEMNGKLIAAGKNRRMSVFLLKTFNWLSLLNGHLCLLVTCELWKIGFNICRLPWHSAFPHFKKTKR